VPAEQGWANSSGASRSRGAAVVDDAVYADTADLDDYRRQVFSLVCVREREREIVSLSHTLVERARTHTHTHVYMYIYVCMYVCIHMFLYVWVCMCVFMHA